MPPSSNREHTKATADALNVTEDVDAESYISQYQVDGDDPVLAELLQQFNAADHQDWGPAEERAAVAALARCHELLRRMGMEHAVAQLDL